MKLDSENLREEEAYIMQKSGLNRFHNMSASTIGHDTPVGGNTGARMEEYYSKVPCDIVKKLLEVYKADMELFDYSAEPYLSICQTR